MKQTVCIALKKKPLQPQILHFTKHKAKCNTQTSAYKLAPWSYQAKDYLFTTTAARETKHWLPAKAEEERSDQPQDPITFQTIHTYATTANLPA
jgi:hypothetical protein